MEEKDICFTQEEMVIMEAICKKLTSTENLHHPTIVAEICNNFPDMSREKLAYTVYKIVTFPPVALTFGLASAVEP